MVFDLRQQRRAGKHVADGGDDWRDHLNEQSWSARVLTQGSEVALDLAVPLQSRDGTTPATLHLLQRRLMSAVTVRDGVLEVLILGDDDVVGVIAVV